MAGDDDDVRLPLVLGPVSNGEFLPLAATPADARLARTVLDRANALAMDRRLFLQTAGGTTRAGRPSTSRVLTTPPTRSALIP